MNNRIRVTINEAQRNTFYKLYKFLYSEEFKELGSDAREAYSLLRDRHELSVKNNWVNENGEVYLIYSRENLCKMLNVSENTVRKIINKLKQFNLIEEERMGQGKPNRIYIQTVKNVDIPLTLKYCVSEPVEFEGQNPNDLRAIKTDISENNYSENILSDLILSSEGESENFKEKTDQIRYDKIIPQEENNEQQKESSRNEMPLKPRYDYTTVMNVIKSDIEYNNVTAWEKVRNELKIEYDK